MRIRSIKPEFWRSTAISAISDWGTRLLFIGLWSYVDDNGVGLDRLSLIVTDLFPDDVERDPRETFARVSRGLEELAELHRIVRYKVRDKNYLFINNWSEHQKIDKPAKERYPLPTSEDAEIRETLARVSRESSEPSGTGTGEQGNRGTGEQESPPSGGLGGGQLEVLDAELVPIGAEPQTVPSTQRGHRIPDNWEPPENVKRDLAGKYPNLSLREVLEDFQNYWASIPGKDGRRTDWSLTFRNRVRQVANDPRFQLRKARPGADTKIGGWDEVMRGMQNGNS